MCTTKGNHSVKTNNKKECYMKLKTCVHIYFFVYKYYVKKPNIINKIDDLPSLVW